MKKYEAMAMAVDAEYALGHPLPWRTDLRAIGNGYVLGFEAAVEMLRSNYINGGKGMADWLTREEPHAD